MPAASIAAAAASPSSSAVRVETAKVVSQVMSRDIREKRSDSEVSVAAAVSRSSISAATSEAPAAHTGWVCVCTWDISGTSSSERPCSMRITEICAA